MLNSTKTVSLNNKIVSWTWFVLAFLIFISAVATLIFTIFAGSNLKHSELPNTQNLVAKTVTVTSFNKTSDSNGYYTLITESHGKSTTLDILGKPVIKNSTVTYYVSSQLSLGTAFASREVAKTYQNQLENKLTQYDKYFWISAIVIFMLIFIGMILDFVTKQHLSPRPMTFIYAPIYFLLNYA